MKKTLLIAVLLVFAFASTAHAQITKDQYYARSTLSGNELEFYDYAYDAISNGEDTIYPDQYELSDERGVEIRELVYNDSPELFMAYGEYSDEEVEKLNAELATKAEEIIGTIPESASEYEKVKTIYYWVGKNITYDNGAATDISIDVSSNRVSDSQTITGGLINKNAVCAGMARTIQYLLYQVDIPCYCVVSSDHMWNIINIDGEWYNVDITEDWETIKYGVSDLKVFLWSDDEFYKNPNHTLEEVIKNNPPLPPCTSTKYMTPEPTVEPTVEPTPVPILEVETSTEKTPITPFIILIAAVIAGIIITIKKRK